ncbi:MAG TPA: glucosamine-6-phosphate deaminase [Puia sp.]|nr:glucosamine-6-phosphate deaminase [Puia sp.]
MKIIVKDDPADLGRQAGRKAAQIIRAAIKNYGSANIILATGTSQFETLRQLTREEVNWKQVTMFHLDEYIGLPESSPAGFRRYLKERFIQKTDGLKEIYLINGEADPAGECLRLNKIIHDARIDIALLGIGENGHLGFNDPPADFETDQSFIVVNLDEKCRRQQLGEGWFQSIHDVPRRAITMSVKQIMKSKQIICSVPDSRKAQAVKDCFENPVSNLFPGSILQEHPHCICFLDKLSSALLEKNLNRFDG